MIQLPLLASDPSLEQRLQLSKQALRLLLHLANVPVWKRSYHLIGQGQLDTALVVAAVDGQTVAMATVAPQESYAAIRTYGRYQAFEQSLQKKYVRLNDQAELKPRISGKAA